MSHPAAKRGTPRGGNPITRLTMDNSAHPTVHVSALPPPAATDATSSKLAHRAFWVMTRRVTMMAAGVDFALLLLFLYFDAPLLAWLNLVSIGLYGCAYWLLTRRMNASAIALIWLEVLGHAAIGTMLIGWDSGFHYYLLMFIPAIVVSAGSRLRPYTLLLLLFVFYIGLHTVARWVGPTAPLDNTGLWVVHGFNVAVVFAMAAYTARFYYRTVRRAEKKLADLAATDPLTGLSNRRNLLSLAEQVLAHAERTGHSTALVLADIDHFKAINDQHGHEAGDQVLVHIGTLLSETCRAQDIVARWGGEEFLLLLPATDAAAALALAERIRSVVTAQPLSTHKQETPINATLSLGVTVVQTNEPLASAIARADGALYRSKEQGRNRVTTAELVQP